MRIFTPKGKNKAGGLSQQAPQQQAFSQAVGGFCPPGVRSEAQACALPLAPAPGLAAPPAPQDTNRQIPEDRQGWARRRRLLSSKWTPGAGAKARSKAVEQGARDGSRAEPPPMHKKKEPVPKNRLLFF
jgi:hypothetical protein